MAFHTRTVPIDWAISDSPVAFAHAMTLMEARADSIRRGEAPELIWLLEHPPVITAGTSARAEELIDPNRFDVFKVGRGGRYTYHGPGQRVAYVMLDLKARGGDVRGLIENLEAWISATLAAFNIRGETRDGRIGIWVQRPGQPNGHEDKIAAVGLRVSRGVTTHGVSLNVEPDLSHFAAIVPCGIEDYGVTSLTDLGLPVTMLDVDVALRRSFEAIFGRIHPVKAPD